LQLKIIVKWISPMKLNDIKISKTFSAIILIVVISVFLLPVLGMNFMFWLAERKEQGHYSALDKQIENRIKLVTLSLKKLNIADPSLFNCISEIALDRANVPPTSSGGIDSVVELQWLSCTNKGITSLDGIEALEQLSSIDLRDNTLVNINVLAQLRELEDVDLSNNAVTSLEALATLPRLKEIRLSGNQPDSIKPLLAIASLKKVDMPDTTQIYCVDVEEFLNEAKFIARHSNHNQACKGEYSSDVGRVIALKNAGDTLTPEDESLLLEYELHQMKKNYKQKYQ
jgi:Leucine-rich repeat (LRR) protein